MNNSNKKNLLERLQLIDRRYIFICIALAVIIPIIFQISFREIATDIVRNLYDEIDNLPPGSRILLSFDYAPTTAPEIQPMVDAIIWHAAKKNLKIYLMAVWATGHSLVGQTIDSVLVKEFPDFVYGEDYVNLGYKAGNQGLIRVIVDDIKRMYSTDANGTDINLIPMMKTVSSLKDMNLIISFGGGTPGVKEWILYAGDPGNIRVGGCCTAVSAPLLYPYYPNQMIGLLGGIKGAAEYESQMIENFPEFRKRPTPALELMGPQTVAHIVIMFFIIFGNVMHFINRARQKRLEAGGNR
jgi:hypothetical protein